MIPKSNICESKSDADFASSDCDFSLFSITCNFLLKTSHDVLDNSNGGIKKKNILLCVSFTVNTTLQQLLHF